jgi:hypothetical protein
MKRRAPILLAACVLALALLGGCAGYDGRTLLPGQSTRAEVEKLMGPAKDTRTLANGETVLWYPRQPAGQVSYAARIGKDDRLIAVEQRLTAENLARLQPGVSRDSDVLDVLGPPWRIDSYPRMQRDAWTWQAQGIQPQLIVVQVSKDHIVRETYMFDDPDYVKMQSAD